MKVAFYVGGNSEGWSITIMARDLSNATPNSTVVHKLADLKGADVIVNLVLEDFLKIESSRRYIGYGKQLCLVSGALYDFKDEELVGYLAYLGKVKIVLHSPHQYDIVLKRLSIFNPVVKKEYSKNVILCTGGITDEFRTTGTNDKNTWIVPCNRFGYTAKNTKLHMEVMSKVKVRHPQIVSNFYIRDSEDIEELVSKHDLNNYSMQYCPDTRAEYIANAQKSGMFLCTSIDESFGLMVLELIACGCVGVFLDAPWVRRLLPDYKFIASKSDLPAMLLSVYNNYDQAKAYALNCTVPFINQNYSHTRFVEEMQTIIGEVYVSH